MGGVVFLCTAALLIFGYFYFHYARLIDEKLAGGPLNTTSMLFGAPTTLTVGDETTVDEVVAHLRRAGYTESRSNRMGWYRTRPGGIEIFPGVDSYFQQEAGVLNVEGDQVTRIVSLRDHTERPQYLLEPQLITNLFDRKREKRRFVKFEDLPRVMVNAVTAAEDKRFFLHAGFDPLRVIKAAYVDLKEARIAEGASTLSMQLAGMLWLDRRERTWKRKAAEVMITIHLEQKLSKQEIFEHYANQIYLGRRGSFNIHGFGEGAEAFFGKDVRQLSIAEVALLAGLIQSPSRYNPLRSPERARARRNVILQMMKDNGHITAEQHTRALAAPLGVVPSGGESDSAPYFVDLVNDQLQEQFQDHDFQANSYRVYTTLDVNLQRAASEAVAIGLREVDEQLVRRGRTTARGWPAVQVALVAVDPRSGEVKALVGGRDYGASQLNRALARRQPGSVFKPFVYATVLNTAIEGGPRVFTPLSTVEDEPTTFWFDNKPYEPNNYKSEFHGLVTLRQALSKSMNIPTVKFAEQVGYDSVVDLARRAGLNMAIQPTPAVALGAYEVRPVEIAGAYSVFANNGVFAPPHWIKMIRDQSGHLIHTHKPQEQQVLDPRVAFMMVDLMQEVLRTGTGAGVRARGFTLPAAGKTGTSHDGWFAGFTTELIALVWVGYDDNRELKLEGARSALPIWAEFMKRAHQYRPYRRARAFPAPDGIVAVDVDPASGKLAAAPCASHARTEVFIAGTEPQDACGGGSSVHVAGWETTGEEVLGSTLAENRPARRHIASIEVKPRAASPARTPEVPKKKGFFSRVLDMFK